MLTPPNKKKSTATTAAAIIMALAGMSAPVLAQSPPGTAAARAADATGIYIPADKRHLGLSRFDLLPFTDRKKGDPDRYRALNPSHVQKHEGNYYFLLTAEPETHVYDENLNDKGVLPDSNLAVDLTNGKEVRNAQGRTVRYVYARDRGYVLRSALPSAARIKEGKWFRFPLKPGSHPLFDGTGVRRGTLAADSVRLNYGQQKQINGETCYYAFATSMTLEGTGKKSGASGWIKASAIQEGNDAQYSSEVVTRMQPTPTLNDTFTVYEVTGGDPQVPIGKDANGRPTYKYGYTGDDGGFIAYKVLPGVALVGGGSVAATDYLKRNDDVINLGFNVSGVSNDTYRVSSAKRPLTFHRSSDKDATAIIDLFYPKDATHDGLKPIGKMIFVYGYIDEGSRKRWGWIPLDALTRKPRD
jgi:hypothetical protein